MADANFDTKTTTQKRAVLSLPTNAVEFDKAWRILQQQRATETDRAIFDDTFIVESDGEYLYIYYISQPE
jgi:hypothetical protein